jgi:non-lysosomal glucosylceramidase
MDKDRVISVLITIMDNNVRQYMGGKMGAANGFCPKKGRPDRRANQAEEMWTGVSYAVAATMIHYVIACPFHSFLHLSSERSFIILYRV